jgi:GNAT superfamily N-acetyltransferase
MNCDEHTTRHSLRCFDSCKPHPPILPRVQVILYRQSIRRNLSIKHRGEHRLAEGPVWLAVEDETVVGTISGVPQKESLLVRSLAVLPNSRGRDIGRALLSQVENYAHENGYKRLILSTTPFLTPAIMLYERFGFQRSSEGPMDRLGTPIFTMVKVLKSNP